MRVDLPLTWTKVLRQISSKGMTWLVSIIMVLSAEGPDYRLNRVFPASRVFIACLTIWLA